MVPSLPSFFLGSLVWSRNFIWKHHLCPVINYCYSVSSVSPGGCVLSFFTGFTVRENFSWPAIHPSKRKRVAQLRGLGGDQTRATPAPSLWPEAQVGRHLGLDKASPAVCWPAGKQPCPAAHRALPSPYDQAVQHEFMVRPRSVRISQESCCRPGRIIQDRFWLALGNKHHAGAPE